MANPFYPRGLSERDISHREPVECDDCQHGQITASPCCGSQIQRTDDAFVCATCRKPVEIDCQACDGEGVVWK